MFLIFVMLLSLLLWLPRKNPDTNSADTQSQTASSSLPLSSTLEGEPSANRNRSGQARGAQPARKMDDEIARILRGDIITNIYILSSNTTLIEEGQFPPIFRKFGTEEFERLAKEACEKEIKDDPIGAEYLEILEDHPSARDSGLIYSGIYIIYNSSEDVRGRRYNQGQILLDMLRKLEEAQAIQDSDLRGEELRSIRWFAEKRIAMDRLKQQVGIDRTRRLLEYLYGDFPKAVFQRLLSIEPAGMPDPLPDP